MTCRRDSRRHQLTIDPSKVPADLADLGSDMDGVIVPMVEPKRGGIFGPMGWGVCIGFTLAALAHAGIAYLNMKGAEHGVREQWSTQR